MWHGSDLIATYHATSAHMGPKTKSAHLLRWHYGERVILRQFSNSFPKTFQLSLWICIHLWPELQFLWISNHLSLFTLQPFMLWSWITLSLHTIGLGYPGLTWLYCISTNKSFSSSKTSSRTPYSNYKQQEKQKHSAENTINFSGSKRQPVSVHRQRPRAVQPVLRAGKYKQKGGLRWTQEEWTPTWRQRQRLRHRQGRRLALYLRWSPYMGQWIRRWTPWMASRRPSGPCPSRKWSLSLSLWRGRERTRARRMLEKEQTKERNKGKTRRMTLPSKAHQALLASRHHPLP